MDKLNHFWWKLPIDPSNPKWPQINIWPHSISRGSQAEHHVWVLWLCYVVWTSYNIFGENDLLSPVTPNDLRSVLYPGNSFGMEGLKLINMYESYGHAVYMYFWWKCLFDPSDPKWPQIYIWPHNVGRISSSTTCMDVIWTSCSIFCENGLLTTVTQNDLGWIFRPITFVEGIQLINA